MAGDWLLVTTLAIPHLLYAYIWFFPDRWRSLFHKKIDAVYCFAYTAGLLKALQFSVAAYWYALNSGWTWPAWRFIEPRQYFLSICLFVCGQALNMGAYRALKTKGIYYGTKLGYKVKWQTGFPFSVVSHPQYVGSALTVWAIPALLWDQHVANASLLLVALYWTLLYVVTGFQEHLNEGPARALGTPPREPLFDSPGPRTPSAEVFIKPEPL